MILSLRRILWQNVEAIKSEQKSEKLEERARERDRDMRNAKPLSVSMGFKCNVKWWQKHMHFSNS